MTIEGRINVDALFHDRDGTTAMKVVSLRSSNEYTTGKVAIITGTAGTASIAFNVFSAPDYPDVTGVSTPFSLVKCVAFSWGGGFERVLSSVESNSTYSLPSSGGRVAIAQCDIDTDETPIASHVISSGLGTGTYKILIYGT